MSTGFNTKVLLNLQPIAEVANQPNGRQDWWQREIYLKLGIGKEFLKSLD